VFCSAATIKLLIQRDYRAAPLLGQPGHDQEPVADRLVELDGLLERIALDGVETGVGAGAAEAVVVEELPQLGRAAAMVAGELDFHSGAGRPGERRCSIAA